MKTPMLTLLGVCCRPAGRSIGVGEAHVRGVAKSGATALVAFAAVAILAFASQARAATPAPAWAITIQYADLAPGDSSGGSGYFITATNTGASPTDGSPVTITDTLPSGLTIHGEPSGGEVEPILTCSPGPPATCVDSVVAVAPGRTIYMWVPVDVAATPPPSVTNQVSVEGGGAATVSATSQTPISATPTTFGLQSFDGAATGPDGLAATQAGSHPFELRASFTVNARYDQNLEQVVPDQDPKNLTVNVPPGLVVNPNATSARCTEGQLEAEEAGGCPTASAVGTVAVITATLIHTHPTTFESPIYNMVPPPGVPAEFGFNFAGLGIYEHLLGGVQTGGDFGLFANLEDIPQRGSVLGALATLWGNPTDPSHDAVRGECDFKSGEAHATCPVTPTNTAFLTLPTACEGPQRASMSMNSWQDPNVRKEASFLSHDTAGNPVGITGCEHLSFGPTISTAPDTSAADTPAGLSVEVKPPLGGLLEPNRLGASNIKATTVTLPEGIVINPGQAAGLKACQETESESGIGTENAPSCPLASKVGTVRIKTPLLEGSAEKELEGNVFVLQSNPPQLHLLVAVSGDGLNFKLVGVVHLDEQTGRLTTTFGEQPAVEAEDPFLKGHLRLPQLPFDDFKLSFSGGAQAALDTPTACGVYEANADFTPWSGPFISDVSLISAFQLTSGPLGAPCPSNPLPFAPTMIAGSTTDQAGAFTNFSLLLQRGDAQQRIEKLQFKEPAGLAGLISSVPLCPEPQASQGTCPAASHIGHAVVTSGPGPYPLVIPQPGEPEAPIFLTGPFKGAPFGLSIVTHVIAGPFDLGTIVTRAKIEVDPRTAQITITTDPLPQIVKGVPTDLRLINSVIDRPNFLFNPTNCNAQEFSGTAWGTPPPGAGGPGATAPVSSHFGVGSCQSLKFSPKLTVSTAGKTSKANGASLLFKISYPKGAMGTQSWFNEAKFSFPKQLPARLTTIQKACLASVFESNPAACPPGSLIGHAVVHTQVLPVPLEGPVYFVSYGAAKFPDAVLVLQGDGVTVDLHGETFINGKTGVTSATFANTPDVPFESIEVTVPSGPTSEFAANLPAKAKGSFCGQKLVMPTLLKAQNGLEIKQSTLIGVTGCKKAKKATRAQKLAQAMRACAKKPRARRAECARGARRRFGVGVGKG